MNQILYEDVEEKRVDIKKILLFFGIALIVFGVALSGTGIYKLFINDNKPAVGTTKPVIEASINDDNSYILIKVTHDKAIKQISYNWNNDNAVVIQGNNRAQIQQEITVPLGENILNITATDITGAEQTFVQTYVQSNNGVDIQKPTIDLSLVENQAKLKILAQDEKELSYITYRWNNEEEIENKDLDESKTIIQSIIDIPRGENTLTVIAVDSNNNTETKIQKFKAVAKPTIRVRQYGEDLTIYAEDEVGIKKVEYTLNGEKNRLQLAEETNWEYTIRLTSGENDIIIEVWNTNDVMSDTFHGRAVYTP